MDVARSNSTTTVLLAGRLAGRQGCQTKYIQHFLFMLLLHITTSHRTGPPLGDAVEAADSVINHTKKTLLICATQVYV